MASRGRVRHGFMDKALHVFGADRSLQSAASDLIARIEGVAQAIADKSEGEGDQCHR